jgi:hypothetical protein
MAAGFQPCLRLRPDDIPRERLEPLAGRNCRWRRGESNPQPCASSTHGREPSNAPMLDKGPAKSPWGFVWPFVFVFNILRVLYKYYGKSSEFGLTNNIFMIAWMGTWEIFDYVEADGTNAIRVWIDSLPTAAQVKIDTIIRYLEATQVWPPQYISALKDCAEIYELRIVSAGVQYRPLGYFGPGPGRYQFTLLMGAIEKGGKLEPREFCKVATRRREIVNGDRNRIAPHRF